jgi:ABC-type transport system involved in Fe-S cluster assembly fused permease/ATPase subunit
MRGMGDSSPYSWSGDWAALKSLVPYLAEFRGRVVLALACLVLAKLANVLLPITMKFIVDGLDSTQAQVVAVPVLFLIGYGLLRLSTIVFGEIRDTVFGRVTERAMRRVGLKVFEHLHALELDFHLSRRTGGLARDIERGSNGMSFLMRFTLFNIVPTLFEILLVAIILLLGYSAWYALVIVVSMTVYIGFSVMVTEWRTQYVRAMNEMDNKTNTHAVDSLLNFETVKYFANETYEAREYDGYLAAWERTRMQNRLSLAALNCGQALVIAVSMTVMMFMASRQVVAGTMTLGDLVLVNAYMMQLFIPLNFLGFVYREIKRALADIEHMFAILQRNPGISDEPDAKQLRINGGTIRFEDVSFGYRSERKILHDVSFEVPAGHKVAVVGPSGAGKSTLARLLFRFYDVDEGRITIDGQDLRTVTQHSLRQAIGVVPQDTVLFNNTIYYNIAYGRPGASENEIREAVRHAHLDGFITSLPKGYDTLVGERGLKVSGGEKQRIAIARMLLKQPKILVFDEATSSLDSKAESAILGALREVAADKTTLVIAHRLSTIVDADSIVVLDHGRVVEHGDHHQLLALDGTYAHLWQAQQRERAMPAIEDKAEVNALRI